MAARTRKPPAPLTTARRVPEADALTTPAAKAPAAAVVEPVDDAPEARKKIGRTVSIYSDLLERARAAATYVGAYEPDAGVQNLSDLVNPGLEHQVKALEDKYNDGKPFRQVSRMPTGRPRKN